MKKDMKNTKTGSWFSGKVIGGLFTASFLLFGAPSFAQDLVTDEVSATAEEEFNEWDTDSDNLWSEDEFGTALDDSGFYDEWDADDDGFLADDELYDGVYGLYDEDDDGFYSEEEFDTWNTAWGGDYDYDAWDTNDDGVLDEEEYDAGIEEAGVYDDWDTDGDGVFSEDEVSAGLFDTWDTNDDNYLGYDEFEANGYGLW